jgi:DNA modification methylase
MPHRVAIALQEDGWWVRQDIVWHKPNPMPESVRDRCTKAHEYIFMLTKSKKYYYDHMAVKEESQKNDGKKRNRRSVWKVPVFAYKGAHFATYPPRLIEPCILSSTSQAGHCVVCGSRWRRVIERKLKNKPDTAKSLIESAQHMGIPDDKAKLRVGLDRKSAYEKNPGYHMLGWDANCDCDSPTEPDVVLDPFMGSGTTAVVARQHGRHFIGIDLSAEYLELANKRISLSE